MGMRSLCGSQYALVNFFKIYKSGHGIIRLFFLHLQALVGYRNSFRHSPLTIYVVSSTTPSRFSSPGLRSPIYG